MDDKPNHRTGELSESVDEMFKHLPDAKKRAQETSDSTTTQKSLSKKERLMQSRPDPAVLGSNHEVRLQELAELDKVTHRAGKAWVAVKAGLESHARIPIYYRLDGLVTHKGYITEIVIRPEDETDVPQVLKDNITQDDTYRDFNDKYDKTTYLVSDGERLDEPFSQSELERIEGGEYVDKDFSYQPAYVRQRDGDFPDF